MTMMMDDLWSMIVNNSSSISGSSNGDGDDGSSNSGRAVFHCIVDIV